MRLFLRYLRPYGKGMAVGFVIKFIGTIMDLLLPAILAHMVDKVVPMQDVKRIIFWGVAMLACSVAALAGNVIANRMAAKVARNVTEEIRHDLFSKISYLSCRQTDSFTIPSLISRLTTDTYNVHQVTGSMQRIGVRAPILLIGGILITMTLDWALALVLLALLPLVGGLAFLISRKGIPLYQKLQESVDGMVRTLRENITGMRVIKALSKTEYEQQRFATVNAHVRDTEKTASMAMAVTNPLINLLLNVGLTLVILVGAFRADSGLTQPGSIMAFLTYFTIILNAMMTITRIFVMFSRGAASLGRISKVMEAPETLALEEGEAEDSPYYVEFDNVSFGYAEKEGIWDVENLSFRLKKGQTLGIIGGTGSGKSTVLRLLMRFYDVGEGQIRIGGRDVKTIPPQELYTMFGVVFQDDTLFADTIEENIRFGRLISEEGVLAAAEYAQASEFISMQEQKFSHKLTARGTNLSGGQKQRLLIARALAAGPDILLLDDSSSALDYKTDALLRSALKRNFDQTTTFVVAQRVSSIRHADQILMLEDGRILGLGTHEELMESCPDYRHIYQMQMGGGESCA